MYIYIYIYIYICIYIPFRPVCRENSERIPSRKNERGAAGASQGLRTHALLCDVAREGFNPPVLPDEFRQTTLLPPADRSFIPIPLFFVHLASLFFISRSSDMSDKDATRARFEPIRPFVCVRRLRGPGAW